MTILSYSPSHVDSETLERLTIGPSRQRLLETLVEAVRAEVDRAAHQHHLLIGPRGSGKTHTLTLVAHRLWTDPELSSRTLPLVLAEEEVARHPADLLIKILEKLAAELAGLDAPGVFAARKETRAVLAALRSEGDDERALETAMGGLEAASAVLDRLLVVTVENLHLLLYAGPGLSRRSVEPGQWALRRLLLPSRSVLLLAGAPSLFGEVCDRRAPFFDFFRIHQLEELPPEEMLDLIRTRLDLELQSDRLDPAQHARLGALAEGFDQRAAKLRGLLALTGGLPRFAHLLFDLLAETDLQRSVDLLSRFLDEQTPYFQARLDPRLVPEAELEILDFLATSAGPQTTTEIAAGLRAKAPNAVATYLKRLLERGLVRQTGTSRRDVRYDVSEPLFRVWRRFRIGRAEREQIALLAELVAAIFEPQEIKEERQLLEGMGHAVFRLRVLEAAREWQARRSQAAMFEALFGDLTEEERAIGEKAEHEFRAGSSHKAYELYDQLMALVRQRNFERLRVLLIRFSVIAYRSGHLRAALKATQEAEVLAKEANDNFTLAYALKLSAESLLSLNESQPAMEAVRDAELIFKDLGDDQGLASVATTRAQIFFQTGNYEKSLEALSVAEQIYRNVDDEAGQANVVTGRAHILSCLGETEAALAGFQEAEALYRKEGDQLGVGSCHRGYGLLFLSANRWEEGIDYLLAAHQLAKKAAHQINTNLARKEAWGWLLQAGEQLKPSRFQLLIRKAEPLIREAGEDEAARVTMVRFVVGVLARMGPGRLLEILPILEAGLQDPQRSFLQPIRLAAEIRAGRRSADLPEEPDEMRRAVREVLTVADQAAPKEKGKTSRRKRAPAKRPRKAGPPPS